MNVLLLFGGDVIESFDKFYADGTPVWDREDVEEIISAGIVVRSRPGSDPEQTLKKLNLNENSDKVHFIKVTRKCLELRNIVISECNLVKLNKFNKSSCSSERTSLYQIHHTRFRNQVH